LNADATGLSELGPGEDIPPQVEAARKAMEERLFFGKFEDFVRAKLRVRNSREIRYGRENIVGVGVGWKNWPEGPLLKIEDYSRLLQDYRDIRKSGLDPYDWFEIHRDSYFNFLHRHGEPAHFKNFGEQCVRVLVNKKAPEKLVEPDAVVSTVMKESGFDVLTDVVEVGEIILASNNAVYRPVTCGVSGGHGLIMSGGTLGCVVKRKSDGKSLLLSCNHVVANTNNATRHRDPVIQPSNLDRGTVDNIIGILDDFIDLDFSGRTNYVDVALVDIDPGIRVDPSMEGAGFVPKRHIMPQRGLLVKKVGRTTEETRGLVNGVHLGMQGIPIDIPYGSQYAKFADIFSVGHIYGRVLPPPVFADKGDSGSLIVEDETGSNQGVGLLFAISTEFKDAYGCTLARISSELDVEL
jgi:hypothetical protein